jgi:hypothetical protein
MCVCVCVFVRHLQGYCVARYCVTGSVDEQLYIYLTAESSNVAPHRGSRSARRQEKETCNPKKKKTSLHASSVMAWAPVDTLPELIALVLPSPEAGRCVGPGRVLLLLLRTLCVCVSVSE